MKIKKKEKGCIWKVVKERGGNKKQNQNKKNDNRVAKEDNQEEYRGIQKDGPNLGERKG